MHVLYGGPPGGMYALYGAREPLLQAPLQFAAADAVVINAFIEPYFQTPASIEIFRHALIAQGLGALSGAGLRAQVVHALQTGVFRIAPVTVSGLQIVKTEPAKAALSGKPYVPPRVENPRPASPPPPPRHKVALELAGQHADSVADQLAAAPLGARQAAQRKLSPQRPGNDPHRLEWTLEGLDNVPHLLEYHIAMRGSTPMRLRLLASMQPVDQDTQQTRWPIVLVPLLLLRHLTAELDRTQALKLSSGWVYVFLNGHLWRELQVVNIHGALSDVDLGTPEGVGDVRVARGHNTQQVVVPYLFDGVEQKIAVMFSRRQLTWNALCRLGGVAADDTRFTDKARQASAKIAVDPALRKHLLQSIDLSSYGSGFNVQTGIIGPVASALRPGPDQYDKLEYWRAAPLPVVYLFDRPILKTVIPVPYVPGIFGSRLWNPNGGKEETRFVWDAELKSRMMKMYAKGLVSLVMARDWKDKEISAKTDRLHGAAEVMTGHEPTERPAIIENIKKSALFQRRLRDAGPHPDEDAAAEQEYERRKARGWYGVLSDYEPLLEAIESLDDEHFIFVAYAIGVDWRGDLSTAAAHLKQEIERIQAISDYPELGTKGVHYAAGTHKVLALTHSQGSPILRYASEVLGANKNIQGIVHLNQPTTGAPVLYRRFVTGSGVERKEMSFIDFPDKIFGEILGTTSYHFTRMAGPMPGALSLLPTNDYVHQPGAKPADWLHCPPRGLKPELIHDIYTDVYLNDKVGLIGHKRYDAQGEPKPYSPEEFTQVSYMRMEHGFSKELRPRWYDLPLSQVKDRTALPPDAQIYLPEETPWHHDNRRLRPHAGMGDDEWDIARRWYEKFEEYLFMAQAFHAALGLKHHPNTYVIRSNGVNTVTQVRLLLNKDKNGDAVLECPYERTQEGDGTVPLTSQEALLGQDAQPVGDILTEGHVVHADICKHPDAIAQTKQAIAALVEPLRPKDQDKLYVS